MANERKRPSDRLDSQRFEEMNPYTPPEIDVDEPAVLKPQLDRPPAKPIRSFAAAVIVGVFLSGPYIATHAVETFLCVVAFALTAVWFDRVYSRD